MHNKNFPIKYSILYGTWNHHLFLLGRVNKNHHLRQLRTDVTISGSAIFLLSLETLKRRFAFSSLSIFPTSTSPLQPSSFYFFSSFSSFSSRLFDSFTWPRFHRLFRCNDIFIQFELHLRSWGWRLVVYRVCTYPAFSHSLSLSLSRLLVPIPTPTWMGGTSLTTSSVPSTNRRAARIFSPHRNKKKGGQKKARAALPPFPRTNRHT